MQKKRQKNNTVPTIRLFFKLEPHRRDHDRDRHDAEGLKGFSIYEKKYYIMKLRPLGILNFTKGTFFMGRIDASM